MRISQIKFSLTDLIPHSLYSLVAPHLHLCGSDVDVSRAAFGSVSVPRILDRVWAHSGLDHHLVSPQETLTAALCPWISTCIRVSWTSKVKKKAKCAQDAGLSPSRLKDGWKVSVPLCTWNHHHAELRREPIKTCIYLQWSRRYKIIGYKGFFFSPRPIPF